VVGTATNKSMPGKSCLPSILLVQKLHPDASCGSRIMDIWKKRGNTPTCANLLKHETFFQVHCSEVVRQRYGHAPPENEILSEA